MHGLSDSLVPNPNGLLVPSGHSAGHEFLAFAKTIFLILVIICCCGAPEQIVGSALSSARVVRITKKYKWKYTRFAASISTTGGARLTWTKTISFIFIKISVGRAPHVPVITPIGCAFIILLTQKLKKSKKSRNEHINISYRKWKMTLFAICIATICIQFRIPTKALKFISTSVILCPNHPNIRVIFGLGVDLNNFTHFPSHRLVKEHHL